MFHRLLLPLLRQFLGLFLLWRLAQLLLSLLCRLLLPRFPSFLLHLLFLLCFFRLVLLPLYLRLFLLLLRLSLPQFQLLLPLITLFLRLLPLRALGFCLLTRHVNILIRLLALCMPISQTPVLSMMVMTRRQRGRRTRLPWEKRESSQIFHEVVNLIVGFFPRANLDSPSSSTESFPWLNFVNVPQQRDPLVFLTLFEKLVAVSKEISEQFQKAVQGKKKTSSALPGWGNVYQLSNLPDFHKALKLNESFSCLLDKTPRLVPSLCL